MRQSSPSILLETESLEVCYFAYARLAGQRASGESSLSSLSTGALGLQVCYCVWLYVGSGVSNVGLYSRPLHPLRHLPSFPRSNSYLPRYDVVSHCAFDLHFFND